MLARILFAALLLSGCRPNRDLSQYVQEDPNNNLTARLSMADSKHEAQLREGFHNLEENRWRWTAGKFVAVLRTPYLSPKRGASLKLQVNFPEVVHAKLGPLTLGVSVGTSKLADLPLREPGAQLLTADVPAALCNTDSLNVTFVTSKALPPNTFPGDGRELALILESITLETKP